MVKSRGDLHMKIVPDSIIVAILTFMAWLISRRD